MIVKFKHVPHRRFTAVMACLPGSNVESLVVDRVGLVLPYSRLMEKLRIVSATTREQRRHGWRHYQPTGRKKVRQLAHLINPPPRNS